MSLLKESKKSLLPANKMPNQVQHDNKKTNNTQAPFPRGRAGVGAGFHQYKTNDISKIFKTTYYLIYLSPYLLENNLKRGKRKQVG